MSCLTDEKCYYVCIMINEQYFDVDYDKETGKFTID